MDKYNFIDKPENVQDTIDWILKQDSVAIDTETTGLDPLISKILLIQIGTPARQYVFDVAKIGEKVTKQLLTSINQHQITKVLHNSIFDYMQIKANYGIALNNMKCTMLGEQLLNQGKKGVAFSLEGVTKKYMGIILEKSVRDTFQDHRYGEEFSHEQIMYAAEDVEYLLPIYSNIQKLLKDRDMEELSLLENETAAVLGNMSLDGIYLDKDLWIPLEEKAKVSLAKSKTKLDEHFKYFIEANISTDLFGEVEHVINYNSPKQLLPRLREVTQLELTSTDAKYLEFYKDKHEVIADLIDYRQEQKKISTYGLAFLNNIHKFDNRIHSKYRQLKAQTGRISSDDPNMMNLPKEQDYRTPFGVQDPTWNFISADFSGQELRLLAHASQEPQMIQALTTGVDLHTYSASLLFEKDYNSISPTERGQCKAITFALLYGAGPKKLSTQLKIPYADARALMNRYFAVFTRVKSFMDEIVERVESEHFALSPLDGRRVDLHEIDWDNKAMVAHAINQSKNLPFQGAGASTMKLALVRLNNRIRKNGYNARIVNAIHDEILVEVAPEHTEEVKKATEEEMIKAFNHYADSVPMEVKPKVGKHWIH
jgi:DNA polymerase I-like protein with 3'-5' exonuclease and polymerase domains